MSIIPSDFSVFPRPDNIEIEFGGSTISVNPEGAYLEEFSVGGYPILFPRQTINGKDRGGLFVPFPNGGPDILGGLEQHGFGRRLPWNIVMSETDDRNITLSLATAREYEHYYPYSFTAKIQYTILPDGLCASLSVENLGDKAMPIAPAFHPYFAYDPKAGVPKIMGLGNTGIITPTDISEAFLVPTEYTRHRVINNCSYVDILFPERIVRVTSYGMHNYVIWSDKLDAYICVEPFTGGLEALRKNPILVPPKGLNSDGKFTQSMVINVRDIPKGEQKSLLQI